MSPPRPKRIVHTQWMFLKKDIMLLNLFSFLNMKSFPSSLCFSYSLRINKAIYLFFATLLCHFVVFLTQCCYLYLRLKLKPSVAKIGAVSNTSAHRNIFSTPIKRFDNVKGNMTSMTSPPRKPQPKISRNEPVWLPLVPTR